MTSYELGEMLYHAYGLMSDGAALYFTLVSAYLIVSYIVGAKLTGPQLAVVNVLYVVWTLGQISVQYTQLRTIETLLIELNRLGSVLPNTETGQIAASWGFIGVQFAGLLASLYFMWSVRRPKTADDT